MFKVLLIENFETFLILEKTLTNYLYDIKIYKFRSLDKKLRILVLHF